MGSVDNKKNITPGSRNDIRIQLICYRKCVLKEMQMSSFLTQYNEEMLLNNVLFVVKNVHIELNLSRIMICTS